MTDLLIQNGRVLVDSGWSEPGYLCIQQGKIVAVGSGLAPESWVQQAAQIIDADGMAVLPGLTNAHTHLSQTFMRGLSGGRPLLRWLKELIWPLQNALSLEEQELAALLGLVENLRSGATHVIDHQKITHTPAFSLAVCQAAHKLGMRLTLARAWADKGVNAESSPAILAELTALFERYHSRPLLAPNPPSPPLFPPSPTGRGAGGEGPLPPLATRPRIPIRPPLTSPEGEDPMIRISSGPLTPWRATPGTLQKAHALAKEWGSGTHIHVSETKEEVQMTLDETGLRPVEWLDHLGILDPDCQVVHATWLDDHEIELLRQRDAQVVHCPVSNAVMGSGIARIHDLRQAGMRIRLGTDGPAGNDNQDCFDNMKAALLMAHLKDNNPALLSPADVLHMATAGQKVRVGGDADLILVNLLNANAVPVHDIDSALALCCHGSDVDTVIVAGKVLVRAKRVLVVDENALLRECQQAITSLRKRAGLN